MKPPALKRRKGSVAPAAGRPRGTTRRFYDDPERYRVALFITVTDCLGLKKYPSAYLTALLLLSRDVRAETIQENLAKVSGNLGTKTFESDKAFVRKVGKLINRLDTMETDWLAASVSSLAVLLTQSENPVAIKFAIDALVARGWRETLVGMSERLRPALASNLPPISAPLSKVDRRAIRRLGAKRFFGNKFFIFPSNLPV